MRVLLLFCCVIVVIILKESLQTANEVCEGNVFTGVCLSTGGVYPRMIWAGGVYPSMH